MLGRLRLTRQHGIRLLCGLMLAILLGGIIAALLPASQASAGISLDTNLTNTPFADDSGSTTIAVTTTAAASTRTHIVLFVGWYQFGGRAVSSVSGGSLSWTVDASGTNAHGDGMNIISAYAPSGLASGTTITVTMAGSVAGRAMAAASFRGIAPEQAKDVSGTSQAGSSTTWTSGSIATTNANDLIVGFGLVDLAATCSNTPLTTPDSPFQSVNSWCLLPGAVTGWHSVYRVVSSTGSYTAGGVINNGGTKPLGAAVAYKAAVPGVTRQLGFPVNNYSDANRTSITQSVTVASGVNSVLVVRTNHENSGGAVSGITFNGDALTKLDSVNATTWSRVEVWYLLAPDVTTANVVASKASTGNNRWGITVDVYDYVNQSSPWGPVDKAFADSGTSDTRTASGFSTGDYTIDALSIDSTNHVATVNNSAMVSDFGPLNLGSGNNEGQGAHNTTSGTMAWTWSITYPWSHLAAILKYGPEAPTFSNTGILDDFNRTNSASLGSNWSNDTVGASSTQLAIAGNQAGTTNGAYGEMWWNAAALAADSEVYATVAALPDGSAPGIGLNVRLQTPGSNAADGYRLSILPGSNTWTIQVVTNGSASDLGAAMIETIAPGDRIGLKAKGSLITAYRYTGGEWLLVGSRTDSTYTTGGYIGLWANNGSGATQATYFDDFGGGASSPAPPDAPTLSTPASSAVGVSLNPQFQLRTTDSDESYVRYKIEICSNSDCSSILRTIDQTSSQTGWSGQDQATGTAYTGSPTIGSSTMAVHDYQAPTLSYNTQYWWRAYAIDPAGMNTWSNASSIRSFTTIPDFPTNTTVIDNFDRSNVASVAGQTTSGGYQWAGNQIQNGSAGNVGINTNQMLVSSGAYNAYVNTQFGPITETYVDVPTVPTSGEYIALWNRIQTPGSGSYDSYALVYFHAAAGNATWSLRRYDNGSSNVLSNVSAPAITAGDSIGLRVTGTGSTVTLTTYRKTGGTWSAVGSVNDSSGNRITSAGYMGIELAHNSARIDNFSGGTGYIGAVPAAPTLIDPATGALGVVARPRFTLHTTDAESDYLQYKIEVCSNSDCSSILRTIDQTSSQTGWTSQDTQSGTAYVGNNTLLSSSTPAVHFYQSPFLSAATQYWWRGYAIDPGGTNTWSSASSIATFTTGGSTEVRIQGGTNIRGGTNIGN